MIVDDKVYVLFKDDILGDPLPMESIVGIFSTLEKAQQEVPSDLVWTYNPVTGGYFTWEETFKQGVILDYPGSLFAASSLCTYPLKCHVDFLDVINSHVAVVLYPDDKSYYQEHDKNPARAVVLAWIAYKKGSGL